MASGKFEGIAMLSMYSDDEDDEMNDAEDLNRRRGGDGGDQLGDASMLDVDATAAVDSGDNAINGVDEEQQQLSPVTATSTGTLVDYGHDEAAMSPEAEERGIDAGGGNSATNSKRDTNDKTSPAGTPQVSEKSQPDAMNETLIDTDGGNVAEDRSGVDPLDNFLPPPVKKKCSEELQRKIQKFLEFKRAGTSFNEAVRKKKDYRNPDFLLHAVRYQDIDQIGSCFRKEVFDPHGFDKSDYFDEIDADARREMERISQEKKNRQNLDFVSAGRQSTAVGAAIKPNIPLPGAIMAATGLNSLPPVADSIPREGRQNKKSKWDKIDGTQAAVLSSANAGGHSSGHHKRIEVEDRRSSEGELDRRS